jgi:hypothetical protein
VFPGLATGGLTLGEATSRVSLICHVVRFHEQEDRHTSAKGSLCTRQIMRTTHKGALILSCKSNALYVSHFPCLLLLPLA